MKISTLTSCCSVLLVLVHCCLADYYKLLGVDKNASQEQIKKAYKKLAHKYHPDKNNGDKNAEKKFIEVTKAYEILKDPHSRKNYDMVGNYYTQKSDTSDGFTKTRPFNPFVDDKFDNTYGFKDGHKHRYEDDSDRDQEDDDDDDGDGFFSNFQMPNFNYFFEDEDNQESYFDESGYQNQDKPYAFENVYQSFYTEFEGDFYPFNEYSESQKASKDNSKRGKYYTVCQTRKTQIDGIQATYTVCH